jgi:hypothetical protein
VREKGAINVEQSQGSERPELMHLTRPPFRPAHLAQTIVETIKASVADRPVRPAEDLTMIQYAKVLFQHKARKSCIGTSTHTSFVCKKVDNSGSCGTWQQDKVQEPKTKLLQILIFLPKCLAAHSFMCINHMVTRRSKPKKTLEESSLYARVARWFIFIPKSQFG